MVSHKQSAKSKNNFKCIYISVLLGIMALYFDGFCLN